MAETKAAGRVLLPDAVVPVRYDIRLEPDLERFTFNGSIKIEVDVQEATDEISVHAKELMFKYNTVVFRPAEGDEIKLAEARYDVKDQVATFKLEAMLPVGKGFLEMEFVGELNDQMAGFYRSTYKDIKGTSKIMASTQFESLDARRAFPCWDEPARKAVFAVTLIVDADLTAFSNMPETSSKLIKAGKKREYKFMDSPKMSTYLLAFVVGEFDFVQAQTEHGVLVRVYTPPGRSADGNFALSTATKALDNYDDYFGIPYPLPKLDMVAIPEFAAGAMENWGLVTYREVDLLIASGASCNQRQRVCTVVTHELAHQWFGNLVTMMWWDDLWLNEGFASWMENKMNDDIFPDYLMWDQFVSDTQAYAMKLDGLRTSHPIQVPIARAEEVEEVFDAISYCKGASVIRMAAEYLGPEAFRKGLQAYFAKHNYGNTETIDLWNAWADASGKPVKDVMASWTEQMGFPLVIVTNFKIEGTTAILTLDQTWFLADGSEVKPEEDKVWKIPIMCCSSLGVAPVELMETKNGFTVRVPVKDADDFICVNSGRPVPMRVQYPDSLQERLAKAVQSLDLSVQDRAGLILDAAALTKAGKLGADALLKLIARYVNETSYVVWDSVSQALGTLDQVLSRGLSTDLYNKFLDFIATLIKKIGASIGWEKKGTDGHLDGLLREIVIAMQAKYACDSVAIGEARRRFEEFLNGNTSELPDDIKEPVFKIVLKNGGVKEYQQMREIYKKAESNVEKKHVFTTIGQTPDLAKKKEVLEWATSGEILIQDFFYPVGSVSASSKEAGDMVWEFYKENFAKIKEMLKTANPSLMDPMIIYGARHFCSTAKADEIETFFKENPLPRNKRTIDQCLEQVRANASFLDRVKQTPLVKEAFWTELQQAVCA